MTQKTDETIGRYFREMVKRHGNNPFLAVPRDPERAYHSGGYEVTYKQAGRHVEAYVTGLRMSGYGHGHRVAVLLENRPEMLLLKLALNTLGISWVPINPDYRASETAYLLQDSNADLVVTVPELADQIKAAITESGREVEISLLGQGFAKAPRPAPYESVPHPQTEASLIYTSGTTGRPKGCIMGHEYELMMGHEYANCGGRIAFEPGTERVYCPLPLFHVNAAILLFFAVMSTGSCQIIPERFRRTAWWREITKTRATVAHYLGIIIPVLMNEPEGEWDKIHSVKWAVGAGVEPTLHGAFEDRFGFPLIEVWGMTEMCRILADCHEPRQIDTRAIGRPRTGLEVKVIDTNDAEVPRGQSGEMVLRHSEETPRRGAFTGYLNHPDATEDAWRGGWFHTGDTVTQDESGMIYFVDRQKNIIRRSGENIAAAEVEACLQDHANVAQVAVIAVEDDLRDEEVMACIVLNDRDKSERPARHIFDYAFERLTYYKAPGWIVFVDELPVTGTQKIQKHKIFGDGQDPTKLETAYDFRTLKKRG